MKAFQAIEGYVGAIGSIRKNTIRNYKYVIDRFREPFGEKELDR
jgi:hypothetical protein